LSAAIPNTAQRPRIQSLSDLIFGLALSISALTLIGKQPNTTQDLIFSIGLYAFSFLVLIQIWRFYSSVTSVLPSEDTLLVDLNILLLFLVSAEPYLFNELFAMNGEMLLSLSGIYAIDLASMFFILAFFYHSLTNEKKQLVPKSLRGRYRSTRNSALVVALVFAVSVIPYFGLTNVWSFSLGGAQNDLSLRSILWLAGMFLGWSWRLSEPVFQRRVPLTKDAIRAQV